MAFDEWVYRLRRGWSSEAIHFGHLPTLLVAAAAAAFALEGVRLFNVLSNPLSWSGGVLAGAVVGFLLHEQAHAAVARRQGCLAGFVLTPTGLFVTLLSGVINSLLPVRFAIIAPGHVSIVCMGFGHRYGVRYDLIAAAGPAVNIALALAAAVASAALPPAYTLFAAGFRAINGWVALFNLLPLDPLDGSKILRSNPLAWAVMFIAALLLV
ncbi:MAG: hypothetical protein GXO15_06405 [Crenarchaeota archaeon]|nr:hypothetical protein [Thermoproteota archaeon]